MSSTFSTIPQTRELSLSQPSMPPTPPHIAVVPSPGLSHLISLGEFSRRLVRRFNFSVTIIIPTNAPPSKVQDAFLASLPSAISHLLLPPVCLADLPPAAGLVTRISVTMARSIPSLYDALKDLAASANLAAMVVDIFGADTFAMAREFKSPPYIYFLSTAMLLSLLFHLHTLDKTVSCEFGELAEPVQIPGCIPVHGKDLVYSVQDRKSEAYKWYLHHAELYATAEGVIVNTFTDLEPGPIKALQKIGKPPIYTVGPIIQMELHEPKGPTECLKWLDDQPSGSVLFVSFGSGGRLSHDQVIELALGLELSEQRFLWVAKPPDKTAEGGYFTVETQGEMLPFLPKGFVERTEGRSLVISTWAPQVKVLGHGSTGGFLTHCGWNSILENIVHGNGVPFVAWPLFAEQNMNAALVTDGLKVGLRPTAGENGVVGREEIARIVKIVMAGDQAQTFRRRIKGLKSSALKTLSEDGDSDKALCEVAKKWMHE
ncbi:hydroquinone glucosyltransferase-like [Diospyros lotus]|uniref:hydroquinone glucosyltransferase-like n=1 Tax=Diospyros lotus TaxID=55363 RepID=UPI0022520687|nr:hydroquinone glucosyltransferase-like [Diospyros lotus]